jgi:hypothetical protein
MLGGYQFINRLQNSISLKLRQKSQRLFFGMGGGERGKSMHKKKLNPVNPSLLHFTLGI